MGVLGPGWRANLTIGRALRLVVTLTGGGAPGRLDRSTLGHPGKLGFCIAEDEAGSPWEPLHVERGFSREDSVVTVVGLRRAAVDLRPPRHDAAGARARPRLGRRRDVEPELVAARRDVGRTSSAPSTRRCSAPPAGASSGCARRCSTPCRKPARELRRGETTPQVHAADPDALITKWDSPEDIVCVAAGGEAGRYSAVLGPCLGMNSQMVSREVAWST